jgi:hypothetical protein
VAGPAIIPPSFRMMPRPAKNDYAGPRRDDLGDLIATAAVMPKKPSGQQTNAGLNDLRGS